MISASAAIDFVLSKEGGLVDNPNDAGGITNYGISLRFLRNLQNPQFYGIHVESIEPDDIRHLTVEQAKALYLNEFWNHAPFGKINSQNTVNAVFDHAVNAGISPAIKCLQRACWAVMKTKGIPVDDGVLGNITLNIVNQCVFYILPALRAERAAYYRALAEKNSEMKVFLEGWLARAYA